MIFCFNLSGIHNVLDVNANFSSVIKMTLYIFFESWKAYLEKTSGLSTNISFIADNFKR